MSPVTDDRLATFAWRVTVSHVATYMVAGLFASTVLDYASWWDAPAMAHMRPLDSPWVAAGPSLQVLRGLVFAAVLYPFRGVFLAGPAGWGKLWALLVGVGIVSTYGPTPGSIEGAIYTGLPWPFHLFGLPEVLAQSLGFSLILWGWYRRPHRAWGLVLGSLLVLTVLMSLAGVFLAPLAE